MYNSWYFVSCPHACTCTLYSEYIIQRDLHIVVTTKKATFQKHELGHSCASPFLLCGRPLLLSQGRELYRWDYLRNCYWFVFLSLTILCVIVMFILKMKVSNLCNLAVEQHDLCTSCTMYAHVLLYSLYR